MKDVQALSEGRIVLSTGTLYGAIKRLLEQDWIERVDGPEQAEDDAEQSGRPRKEYALTRVGSRALDAEVTRLQRLVTIARPHVVGGQL